MKLLIIRPQPGAEATAARVEAAGHEPLLMPLFAVEAVAWEAPPATSYDGLLLTSANAVRHVGPQLAQYAHLPVYAVGAITARAAEQHDLAVAKTGDSGIEALLADLSRLKLLWLAGEDHNGIDAPPTVEVDLRIVYRSAALPVPCNFRELATQADHILLHSARATAQFSALADSQQLDRACISLAALSAKVALAAGNGWKSIRFAPEPSDAALLSCL